ncbi:hypothetical protein [Polaribacter sp. IC066]
MRGKLKESSFKRWTKFAHRGISTKYFKKEVKI